MITEEDMTKSAGGVLGPEYWAARREAEALVAQVLPQELLNEISSRVAKEVSEAVFESISSYLWDGCLEHNMQLKAHHMVGDVISAILSGNKALARTVAIERFDQFGVRKAIAELIPDEVAKARIADLEKEVARLNDQLRWLR